MGFLFVGGCVRSGTTLVQRVLCSHSRIAGGPEFVFTSRIAELFERMRAEYPEEFEVRLAHYYDDAKLTRAFRDFLAGFFEETANRKPGALYISEKTPSNIGAARALLELFPDARFVHVVRDGRDIVTSQREVAKRLRARGRRDARSYSTIPACAGWNWAVDAHFDLVARAELCGRYHLVLYEELVREPERVLTELFGSLGLELEAAALEPEAIALEDTGLTVDGIWITSEWQGRGFDSKAAGRWRHDLPVPSRLLTELLIGKNLRRMGYPVGAAMWVGSRLLERLRGRDRSSRRRVRANLGASVPSSE